MELGKKRCGQYFRVGKKDSNPRRSQIYSVLMQQNRYVETMGVGSQGYMMVTSAGSCRTREIEGVAAVELVCVGGLLRMGGESLLLPVCRSAGGGLIGKGGLDTWVVRAVT